MPSVAPARRKLAGGGRPRQEAGLITTIAATAASRPRRGGPVTLSGPEPGWASTKPSRPPRGTRHDRAGHPGRQYGKRAHNRIRRPIPAAAMASSLPRYRLFAGETLKGVAAPINIPGERPPAGNLPRRRDGRRGPPPRDHRRGASGTQVAGRAGAIPPLPGVRVPPHRPVTCPGRLPAHRRRNSTEISTVHRESRNNYSPLLSVARHRPGQRGRPITERSRCGRYVITCDVITWQ